MQTPIREIMATASKDTSIRIKESTRFRLDMLKGSKSHDTFVAEMLLYFETTGITPQSNVMPPNVAAKEQDEYMHISQVQELLERSRQLEQEARENREKAGKLQTDLEIARQEKGTPAVGCNTHKILEIVERIDEVKKIPTFNDTVYEIDRNTLDMWVKRLKDELKK